MNTQELKKKISYYLKEGNNLKDFLGEQQLNELKGYLDNLKEVLSDSE